jgi:hypothetical protein
MEKNLVLDTARGNGRERVNGERQSPCESQTCQRRGDADKDTAAAKKTMAESHGQSDHDIDRRDVVRLGQQRNGSSSGLEWSVCLHLFTHELFLVLAKNAKMCAE